MSDLLNSASLVMIPSGYKEDVVYSVIPETGAGDLSFTRASNGTRINSAGLVEVVAWNLCNYSEDQTQWNFQNAITVTANSTTAPNGTLTADTVTPTAVNDDHYNGIGLSSQVGELTAFIYVKPNGYNFFDWGIWNQSSYLVRATFDLVNLTYTFTNAGTATIESVGNGWLKCGISGSNASLSTIELYYRVRATGGSGFFTGNGTSGAFIWGAQLNIGSTAKPYFPTTDRLNVPRLTYQNGGGGCPSLLLEKQSTNIAIYSEQFNDASWTKIQSSITANSVTSPDGTTNADTFTADGTNNEHQLRSTGVISLVNGTTYTTSIFAKAGTNNFVQFVGSGSPYASTTYANFNIATGVVGDVGAGTTAKIENFGNGWYRCSMTATAIATTSTNTFLFNIVTSNTASRGETNTLATSVYVWGAQLEASSYPTSYIPTTSASATRVADACFKTGISSLIGQTEGVFFADINYTQHGANIEVVMSLQGATTSSYFEMYYNNNTLNANIYNTGSPQAGYTSSTQASGRYKIAFAYKANDFAMYINGTQVMTDSSGTVPTLSNWAIGYDFASGLYQFGNSVNQAILFPTRLTNAELASLTTI
jgi:hypothetical protein